MKADCVCFYNFNFVFFNTNYVTKYIFIHCIFYFPKVKHNSSKSIYKIILKLDFLCIFYCCKKNHDIWSPPSLNELTSMIFFSFSYVIFQNIKSLIKEIHTMSTDPHQCASFSHCEKFSYEN